MPYIAVRMLEGRTLEQKRALVRDVTEVVAKSLKISPGEVVMELEEFAPGNIAHGEVPPAES